MKMDKLVCNCRRVTNGMVKEAVDNGATTFEEVQKVTGASTGCKRCRENIERLVEFFVSEKE